MNPIAGFALAVACGALAGAFSFPMKWARLWAWENTWLVWAFVTMLVLPWILALITVPHLPEVLARSGPGALSLAVVFGVCWGLGTVLFGQGIALIGMSLAFAISMGLTTALGALIPMLATPAVFVTPKGIAIVAGVLLMIAGVGICALAGNMKDTRANKSIRRKGGNAYARGITLCVLSGLFSPMINLAFNFGAQIKERSLDAGASEMASADALWAVILLGGLITNGLYCGYLLFRNRAWGNYTKTGAVSHWFLAVLMGLLWFGSIALYGRAAVLMGDLGGSTGWAVYIGCCIMMSNILGIISGEWKDGRGRPLQVLCAGLGVLLVAVGIIGFGNTLA